jgi:hypothetical protein
VPKVQHKPIKSPRKGSNRKKQNQPKAALVWRIGLSGVPPDSVRCTREIHSELLSFEFLGRHSAIIHWTVRCSTRLSDVPSGATVASATVEFNGRLTTLQCADSSRSQSRRQKAHRTVNSTCPVHHQTVRWPHMSELQRSNPNSWVAWLAHQTVSGGALDCLVHPSTAAPPNGHFGGWGYKYPPNHHTSRDPSFQPTHSIQELVHSIQDKIRLNQNLSKSQFQSKQLVTRRESFVRVLLSSYAWIAFLLPILVSKTFVIKARDTNCVVVLVGTKCPN